MSKEIALIGRGRWGQNYINTLHPDSVWGKNYKENQAWPAGVVIATPVSTHFEVARHVIQTGGQNLLIEKPLTATSTEAEKLRDLANQHGTHIMVGHLLLYDPAVQKMFTLAESPTNIEFYGLQSPVLTDTSVLQDWGAHPLYMACHLFNSQPTEISAVNSQNDNVKLTVKFPNHRVASANIGWTSPERKRMVKVSGPKGTLLLDWSNGPKVLRLNDQVVSFPSSPSPLEVEIAAFTHFIKTRKTIAPLDRGIETVRLIETAEKSLQTGKPIEL